MFRLPRTRVVPLAVGPAPYATAVDRYLTEAGISKGSTRIYRISLTNWCWMLAGEPTPTGPERRGAKPPPLQLAALDDPSLPEVLAEFAAARADEMDPDTVNRELSVVRQAIGWWLRQGWITADPTFGIERRPSPPDKTKALSLPRSQPSGDWRASLCWTRRSRGSSVRPWPGPRKCCA